MKKTLIALMALAGVAAAHSIPDGGSAAITTSNSDFRLLYDPTDDDGKVTFSGNLDLTSASTASDNLGVWVGPGSGTTAQVSSQSTRIELSGVISGASKLRLNSYSNQGQGGNAVYVLSNTANTYSGTVELGHGSGANAYTQLSLTADSLKNATLGFHDKNNLILSVEASASAVALTGGNGNTVVTSNSADNTLTLTGDGNYTYKGKIGVGNYINSSIETFSTTSTPDRTSTKLNITKTGRGTQTIQGEAQLGTVNLNAGKLSLKTGSVTTLNAKAGATFAVDGSLRVASLNASGTGTATVDFGTSGHINNGTGTVDQKLAMSIAQGTALTFSVTLSDAEITSLADGTAVSRTFITTDFISGVSGEAMGAITLDVQGVQGYANGGTLFSVFSDGNHTYYNWNDVTFTSGANNAWYATVKDGAVAATLNANTSYLVFSGTAASGASIKYVSYLVVPEPTTATLSLLALAGLAARRRRK